MKIAGTHHIALVTANFEQMRAFYTEALGLPVVGAFGGYPIIFVQVGETAIELIGRATHTPSTGSWAHFALTVDDIDATVAELQARGVIFHDGPRNFPDPPEIRLAFFKDPDGNILELVQPLASHYPQLGMV